MSRPISHAEIDRLVLAALREVAKQGTRARIKGRDVREAAPLGGQCVYARVGVELANKGIAIPRVPSSQDFLAQYKTLLDSMKRLTDNDLLFNNGGRAVEDRTFWVVME